MKYQSLALKMITIVLISSSLYVVWDVSAQSATPQPGAVVGDYRIYLPLIMKGLYTATFPAANPLILGNCPPSVHDRYSVAGPDGQLYRTWHAVTVPLDPNNPSGPACTFAHEHGDPPHPNGPKPAFGYASAVHGMFTEIAAHPGFKVFTHYANGNSGLGTPETDYRGLPIDFSVTIHQGSAGRGRLTEGHHSMEFWSRYQSRETHVFVMANTGGLTGKGCGGGPGFARVVVDQCDVAYELWPFRVNVGGAWDSGAMLAAITNPMNHMRGTPPCADAACSNIALTSTSETVCGHQLAPCVEPLPFGQHGAKANIWLGNIRTIHEPDWQWTNAGGAEYFCTDPLGARQPCGSGTIRQRVAPVTLSNAPASQLLRTNNEAGWFAVYGLPRGAPGGN